MIFIVGLFASVNMFADEESTYGPLTEEFIKILNGDTFRMKTTLIAIDRIETEIYKRKDVVAMKFTQQGQSLRVVFNDEGIHIIVDSERTIYKQEKIDDDREKSLVDTESLIFFEAGKASVDGKKRDYEAYTSPESDAKTYFFVEKGKLVGIRTISGKEKTDLVVVELSNKAPSGVFIIPPDYEVKIEK
jgi:hypothetical protein